MLMSSKDNGEPVNDLSKMVFSLNTISSDSPRQEVQAKSKATQYTKILCFVIRRYLLHS